MRLDNQTDSHKKCELMSNEYLDESLGVMAVSTITSKKLLIQISAMTFECNLHILLRGLCDGTSWYSIQHCILMFLHFATFSL